MIPLKAKRWALENATEAIARARIHSRKGIKSILVHIGEGETDKTKINKIVAEHLKLIESIEKNKLDSEISLKLTNIGLCISRELCYKNAKKITTYASNKGIELWIDMEESE